MHPVVQCCRARPAPQPARASAQLLRAKPFVKPVELKKATELHAARLLRDESLGGVNECEPDEYENKGEGGGHGVNSEQ